MAIAPTAGPAPVAGESAASTQPWPNEGRGWFALAAVIFATFITFLDQTAFALLAEKMKASFGISDFTRSPNALGPR